ncbi:hypothetical protein KKG46_05020 [Patescibacteria group bacterium]|nr:hypothetical protein [Patescibacteria group bacterium]
MNFKKVFSTFVSFVTIMWSVGAGALAFPVTAQAATLNAGDLIKASGPAVYFYANDGKRYVFPNEKTYFSWFNDFSSVVTITDAELAAIMIGGNVTVRPGTKLVKITTDPKTYAVTKCGTLHWIESEAIAKALYGDAWATRVIDVPDSFFVNYTIGSSVSSNVHPDGQLITYTGDTNRYVVMNGQKRMIADDAAFAANHWNMINAVLTDIVYPDGANVTGAEADNFWSVSCSSGAVASGSVTVSLASDTPAGATVPKNAMGVPMVKVNLVAGSEAALVTGLHFHRVGVGSTSDFANVYLYDMEGNRLTTGRNVNSSSNIVEFNGLNINVPANGMKSYYVYADFNNPGTTGGNHAFELEDAASVILSGSGTVGGSFPVRGNVFVVGTASAGTLTIQAGPAPANPVVGSKNVAISSFKLTAATNDIYVNRVSLYQGGTADNSDLSNFELYQGTTKVGSASAVSSKGQIVVTFDSPYLIPNGVTRVFELRANVAGRAGRTIRTYVEYATDIMATDSVYNSGAAIDISSFNGDNTPATDWVEVTTQGGNLTFAFNGPSASSVAKGRLGVVLYEFSLTSSDNDLEIRNLRTRLAGVSGALITGSNNTNYFRNIKIVNTDTGTTLMGPKELPATASDTTEDLTFNDTFNIMAGETKNLAIVADLSNTEDAAGEFFLNNDQQYQASFLAFTTGDVKVVDTGESLDITKIVPNANTTGNALTVKSSSLTAKLASTPVSGTIVKKSTDKPVVGIALEAGAQSAIKVTNLTLDCQANLNGAGYTEAGCAQRITSLSLWDGDTMVGNAKAPDTTTGEAPISNMNLDIPMGTTKNLTVKATFSSAANTTTNDVISVGVKAAGITAQDDDANTITPTIETSLSGAAATEQLSTTPSVKQTILPYGTLTVAQESHPAATIVIAGKDAWVPFARYKATAQFENMLIDLVAVSSTAGGDNANFAQVAVASDGAVKGANVLSAGAIGTTNVDLTGNNLMVPKDGSMTFELWAKLSAVQASSSVSGATTGVTRSGHAPGLGLLSNLQTGQWDANYSGMLNLRTTGEASGERVYATTGATAGNNMVIRKTKPVVTRQTAQSSVLSAGSVELYRAQIGADSAGSVALKQLVFTVSKSNDVGTRSVALSNFRLYKNSSVYADTEVWITNATSGANLYTGSVINAIGEFQVAVTFTGEEVVTGTGDSFSLRATASYEGTGNQVVTQFYTDPSNAIGTGYIVDSTYGIIATSTAAQLHYNIDTSASGDGIADLLGSMIWSDNSEVPHYSTALGSRDWTNNTYVKDLNENWTLSN